jgi:p-hydroxybenzoate 3-monooxygenase
VIANTWKTERFSWWMTSMLRTFPGDRGFGRRLQRADFDHLDSSRYARQALAESYTGGGIV